MFRHVLFPTDGSPLSVKTIPKVVRYAKAIGARITALYVVPRFDRLYTAEVFDAPALESKLAGEARRESARHLARVEKAAARAGVHCDAVMVRASEPYRGILQVARARRCDLIVMASHGRKGVTAMFFGSESRNVLTHSRIPVLIFR